MDISKFTLDQLKALAFDLISQRDNLQANLSTVLKAIEEYKEPEPTPDKKK